MGIAVLAYLFVLRACHHEIVPGKPWSIFQLQHALRLRAMTNQVEHKVKVKMAKAVKLPKASRYGYKVSILSVVWPNVSYGFSHGHDLKNANSYLRDGVLSSFASGRTPCRPRMQAVDAVTPTSDLRHTATQGPGALIEDRLASS